MCKSHAHLPMHSNYVSVWSNAVYGLIALLITPNNETFLANDVIEQIQLCVACLYHESD